MKIDLNSAPEKSSPPTWAFRVPTGVGKTWTAVKMIADDIKENGRVRGRPWVYLVPTHRLGEDIVELFAAHGITAKVWRGRNNPVPGQPDRMMCDDLERVALALKCGLSVAETCCKTKAANGRSIICPFYSTCEYQRQARYAPDVWITAHETLFHSNSAIGKPIGVIVDESFWQDGLRFPKWVIPIAEIGSSLIPPLGKELITADLDYYRNKLADVLSKQKNGGLERKHLAGLTRDDCTKAIKLEWMLMPSNELVPGAPETVLKRVRQRLPQIQFARRMIWLWDVIRDFVSDTDIIVSGRVYVEKGEVKIRDISTVRKRWNVPTILLDATLPDLSVLQAYYPNVEITGDWKVAMPHVTTRQFVNAPVTQRRLMKTTSDGNRSAIRRYILQRWIETGRQPTLVVCQQEYEKWLAGTWLPPNVRVEHYNNVAGLDRYKAVRLLITIGRTLPGPEAIEAMAAALTGKEPIRVRAHEDGRRWYVPQVRGASMKGGTGRAVQCDTHPDPVCEAIRFQICECEIIQAIGRARGVNRTADTPLDIDILGNVVLPITLDTVGIWQQPSTLIELISDGVVLTNRADMVKCWPHIWPNETAAKRALEDLPAAMRDQAGSKFYKERQAPNDSRQGHLSIRDLSLKGFDPVCYQRAGERMHKLHGFFDPGVVPDPRSWLEIGWGRSRYSRCSTAKQLFARKRSVLF